MVFLVMIFFMIAWIPLQVAVLYSVYYHTAHDYGQVIIIIRLMIVDIFESFIYLNFFSFPHGSMDIQIYHCSLLTLILLLIH